MAPTLTLVDQLLDRLLTIESQLRRGDTRDADAGLCQARALLDRGLPLRQRSPIRRGGLPTSRAHELVCYIEEHIGQEIELGQLAALLQLSKSHCCRAFRDSFGRPPLDYVRSRRIERAKELMLTTAEPLASIASRCGFSDQTALCKSFKRMVGDSPARWRRSRCL